MGVYIKGMEMPKKCSECLFRDGIFCMAFNGKRISYSGLENKEYFCPLIEVSEPHGRLIDADAFKQYCQAGMEDNADLFHDEYKEFAEALTLAFLQDIDEQPTIIPEEGDPR